MRYDGQQVGEEEKEGERESEEMMVYCGGRGWDGDIPETVGIGGIGGMEGIRGIPGIGGIAWGAVDADKEEEEEDDGAGAVSAIGMVVVGTAADADTCDEGVC